MKTIKLSAETIRNPEIMKSMGISVIEANEAKASEFEQLAKATMEKDGTNKVAVIANTNTFLFVLEGSKVVEVPDFSIDPETDRIQKNAKEILESLIVSIRKTGISTRDALRQGIILLAQYKDDSDQLMTDNAEMAWSRIGTNARNNRFEKIWPEMQTVFRFIIDENMTLPFTKAMICEMNKGRPEDYVICTKKTAEIATSFISGPALIPWVDQECYIAIGEGSSAYSMNRDILIGQIAKLLDLDFEYCDYATEGPSKIWNSILLVMPWRMNKINRKSREELMISRALSELEEGGRLVLICAPQLLSRNEFSRLRAEIKEKYKVNSIITIERGFQCASIPAVAIVIDKISPSGKTTFTTIPKYMEADEAIAHINEEGDGGKLDRFEAELNDLWIPQVNRVIEQSYESIDLSEIASARPGVQIPINELFSSDSLAGIPYIKTQDIKDETVCTDNAMKAPSKYVQKQIPPGDILLNTRSKNYLAIVIDGNEGPYVPSNVFTILKVTNDDYDPKYLSLYLRSTAFFEEAEKAKTGVAVMTLTIAALKEIQIPALSLQIQQDIIEKIGDSADRKKIDEVFSEYLSSERRTS